MTVKELIKILEKLPPDAPIYVGDEDYPNEARTVHVQLIREPYYPVGCVRIRGRC
jgi:hypothetical protein